MNDRIEEQQDIHVSPTIFLTLKTDGDVQFSTNNPDMDTPTAIFMMEVVKTKMMNTYIAGIAIERQKKADVGVIIPKITRP